MKTLRKLEQNNNNNVTKFKYIRSQFSKYDIDKKNLKRS